MYNPVVKLYAKEFLSFAKNNSLEMHSVQKDILSILDSFNSNKILLEYLKSPIVQNRYKSQLVSSFTENNNILALINIISKKSRFPLLDQILNLIIKLIKEKNGIKDVIVTSVVKVSDEQKTKIQLLVKKLFGCNSEIINKISTQIIGGLTIQVEDKLLDLSIKKQFERLIKLAR